MKKRTERTETVEVRLMSAAEVAKYVGLGLNRAVQFAEEAGARRQFGKRVLYDRHAIDDYIDNMAENGQA